MCVRSADLATTTLCFLVTNNFVVVAVSMARRRSIVSLQRVSAVVQTIHAARLDEKTFFMKFGFDAAEAASSPGRLLLRNSHRHCRNERRAATASVFREHQVKLQHKNYVKNRSLSRATW